MSGEPGALLAADIAEQPAALGRLLGANAAALVTARAHVLGGRVVRLLGIGSSRHAAGYGARALDILAGVPAVVLPAPGMAVEAPQWRAGDVAVAVSQSGRTPALVEALVEARAAGATVVAVTNGPGSPVERAADVVLACGAGRERVVAATKSVTAQALALRALASPLDAVALAALVDAVGAVVGLDVVSALRGEPPGTVVCSGFAAEWVADEIALKFAEAAGRHVTAEPLVEHLHGPIAAPASTLAFLDPDDPNAGGLATGRGLVRVGPDASYDLITPTTGDPSLDAIVTLVAGQRLAAAWAARLGVDPDAARGLSKVTVTR